MAEPTEPTEYVHDLGSGFSFEWEPRYAVDLPELPVTLDLEVVVEEGRLVIVEVVARRRQGGPPITADVLRTIPLATVTALAVTGSSSGLRHDTETHRVTTVTSADALDGLGELPELERVAVVYRWGYFIGQNPTKWVADKLGLGYAVAAKRVQAARLAGLLDPTTKGRKGA